MTGGGQSAGGRPAEAQPAGVPAAGAPAASVTVAVDPATSPAAAVESAIASILVAGTRVAFIVLAAGFVLLAASGRSPLDTPWPALDLGRLPADLVALRPEAFLWAGLLVVLATPLLRVVAATVGFVATGERRMVGLGLAVLVVITLAVVVGLSSGAASG